MKANPTDHQPAGPVAPLEQEHSTYDRNYLNKNNECGPAIHRPLQKVVSQRCQPDYDKQAT
jgi:hypothetical protein